MHSLIPVSFLAAAWRQKGLILQFTKRKVASRYRGSTLGMLWAVLNPLLILAIYTFVFSVVFQSRWGMQEGGEGEFALFLFSGMVFYWVFADSVNESPDALRAHAVYIKQHVFPSEALAWVTLLSALFGLAINLLLLGAAYLVVLGPPPPTAAFLPLVAVPVVLWTLGAVWIVSAVGIYVRDIGQVIAPLTTALLFLSPIFYPASSVPERFIGFYNLNPFVFILETARGVLFYDHVPDWPGLGISTLVAWGVAWAGYNWFMASRKGFVDVL